MCQAKGGKKKGGAKKGSLLPTTRLEPWQSTDIIMQHLLMVESYRFGPFLHERSSSWMGRAHWQDKLHIHQHTLAPAAQGLDTDPPM